MDHSRRRYTNHRGRSHTTGGYNSGPNLSPSELQYKTVCHGIGMDSYLTLLFPLDLIPTLFSKSVKTHFLIRLRIYWFNKTNQSFFRVASVFEKM